MDPDLRSIRLDGDLTTDPDALAQASADFGHIVTNRPRAVLRPGSAADIATVLRFAAEHAIPVVARGCGHTSYGQAQTNDGIVIDMTRLAHVQHIGEDQVTVEAGATWASLLQATLQRRLTPPVLTDYLGLSVGGTLSVGGLGGTSHRYGAQTDTVIALDAVTGDGQHRNCSATESPELFQALLAGYGQVGVIARATLRLVPAPARVRRYKLYYPAAHLLTERQRQLLREGRFDHLQGQILPSEHGWQYMLEAATYYTPPDDPDVYAALDGLADGLICHKVADLSYWEFADRLTETRTLLEQTGEWRHPHPWANLLLPDTAADGFLNHMLADLAPADLGAPGLVLVYPMFTQRLTTPLFRAPSEPVAFLIAALRFAPPNDQDSVEHMIETNGRWYEDARELGGTAYPAGAIPFTRQDWLDHYGTSLPAFTTAAKRFDPRRVLGFDPGHA